jgi:hypothetical protein
MWVRVSKALRGDLGVCLPYLVPQAESRSKAQNDKAKCVPL